MIRPAVLARIAAVVLVVHAWALHVPVAHAARDLARGHAAHEAGSVFGVPCDPDCRLPGHEHHGHDPATCASCRVLDGLGPVVAVVAVAPPAASCSRPVAIAAIAAARGALGRPVSRGPPSLQLA